MDVHSELVSSAKSALSFDNMKYYKAEDSGYHTSFTPGSLEQSDLCSDLDETLPPRTTYDATPNYRRSRYGPLKVHNDISADSRLALKRPYPSTELVKHVTTIPTPTTLLSGKIESLDVNEDKENSSVSIPPESPCSSNSSKRFLYRLQVPEPVLPYPLTPIKRNCRLGPCRSAKKLEFSTHSLLCKKSELQHVPEESSKIQLIPILARPNQKIDILRLLCETHATPALENILQNLNNEDTHNFCLVSKTWCQIWKLYSSKKKKRSYKEYLKTSQENQENCARESVSKTRSRKVHGYLRDLNNEIIENPVNKAVRSPPSSPRSNRFRKFTKVLYLDHNNIFLFRIILL